MLCVVVRFLIKAGHGSRFLERVVQQSVETLRQEPECRQFDVCVDPADSHRILLYEIYMSDAAFGEHLLTTHFRSFDADTRGWVEEKTVERWSKVERVP
jgi:autoinducer 2-degrading protein